MRVVVTKLPQSMLLNGEFSAAKSGNKGLFVMSVKRNADGLILAEQIARVAG